MFISNYMYMLMFVISMFMFLNYYNYLLVTLICLEFVMLSILMMLMVLGVIENSMFMLMYYMIFVVCESVLGLSVLIILIRSYGNDSMKLLNLMMW